MDSAPQAAPARSRRFRYTVLAFAIVNLAAWLGYYQFFGPASRRILRVDRFTPGDRAIVDPRPTLEWQFNLDVVDDPKGEAPAIITPAVAGDWHWRGKRNLIFQPRQDLPRATSFTVTIPAQRLRTPEGFALSETFVASVATAPLRVMGVRQGGFQGDHQFVLEIEFNDAVIPVDVLSHLAIKGPDNKPLGCKLHGDAVGKIIRVITDPIMGTAPAGEESMYVSVRLERGLAGQSGPLGLDSPYEQKVSLGASLAATSATASADVRSKPEIYIRFSGTVDPALLRTVLSVEPPVRFVVNSNYQGVALEGDFRPATRYAIKIAPAPKGADARLYPRSDVLSVFVPDRAPAAWFENSAGYLGSQGHRTLLAHAVNMAALRVKLWRVYDDNLVQWRNAPVSYQWQDPRGYARPVASRVVQLKTDRNVIQDLRIVLDDLLPAGDPRDGVYRVSISSVNDRPNSRDADDDDRTEERGSGSELASSVITLSDIALTAKREAHGLTVWATSLAGAAPLEHVRVRLYSSKNQLLGEAFTGEDGLARFSGLHPAEGEIPTVLLADHAEPATAAPGTQPATSQPARVRSPRDLTWMDLRTSAWDMADADVSGRPYTRTGQEAFVYTDRGVYRPGDTVHLRAIVRSNSGAPQRAMPARWMIRRPDLREWKQQMVTIDDQGSVGLDLVLPEDLTTGCWTAQLGLPGEETSASTFGSATFQVEEYIPNRLKTALSFAGQKLDGKKDQRASVDDDTLRAVVRADYLFGRPAAGLQAKIAPRLAPATFGPDGWAEWSFNDAARTLESDPGARAGVVDTGKVNNNSEATARVLDSSGRGEWPLHLKRLLKIPAATSQPAAPIFMGPWQLSVEATVQEPAGRSVSTADSIQVDALPWYIGVRRGSSAPSIPGQSATFDLALVSPRGQLVTEARTLDVALLRESWNNSLTFRDGRYRYESHRILEPVKNAGSSEIKFQAGRAEVALTPPVGGVYIISVRDRGTGAMTSQSFMASNGSAWEDNVSREHPEHLDLVILPSGSAATQPSSARQAPKFKVGETARVVVRSPFAGRMLFTVETDHVLSSRVIDMTASTVEVPVEITEALRPNAYISASVIRAVDPDAKWRTHRAHGTTRISVDPADHRLAIDIQTPPEIRPLSSLDLSLRVTDAQGHAVANAPVTVAAVDEGILQLTWFRTPDPLGFFHAPRALGVESLDLYSQLMPEVPRPEKVSAIGGDRGAATATRYRSPVTARRVKSVALFVVLRTDEQGIASTHLSIPEFSGQLRIMAVAHAGARFGAAQRPLLVRAPLLVQSTFPRFAAPGDHFSAPVTLFNNGKTDLQVNLTAEFLGDTATRPLEFGASREPRLNLGLIPIKAGGQFTLELPCVASERVGVASLRLTAAADSETATESTELPIRPPSPFITEGGLAVLSPGPAREVPLNDTFFPGTEQTTISVTTMPSLQLPQAIDYLERYPYGCAEQTISTSFTLLYLKDIGANIAPGVFEEKRVADKVQAGILRLLGMQTADGGIAMWPGNRESWPWASIYAAHFLVEAGAAGHAVPPDFQKRLLAYVRGLLDKAGDSGELLESQAYAAYVLALAGKPDRSFMSRLGELTRSRAGAGDETAIRAQARLYLAMAWLAAGRRDTAAEYLPAAIPPLRSIRQGAGNVGSPVRDRAMYLNTLLTIQPDDPSIPSLAAQLAAEKWQTTQEIAFAAMATGKYLRQIRDVEPYDHADLQLDGRAIATTFTTHAPAHKLEASITGPAAARGYLSWTRTGVLRVMPSNEDHGIKVRRRYLKENGEPLTSSQIQSGDLILVELILESASPQKNIVIEDLLPAGLEIENARLQTTATSHRTVRESPVETHREMSDARTDVRDDRMILFGNLNESGVARHVYAARAVVPGTFVLPPVRVESMYDPAISSIWGPGGTLEVKRVQHSTLVEIPPGE